MKTTRILFLALSAIGVIAFPRGMVAQEGLIPPGSVQTQPSAPNVPPMLAQTRPASRPAAAPAQTVSAAELQALFARNAAIIASQKQMMQELDALAEQARTLRIRAARN